MARSGGDVRHELPLTYATLMRWQLTVTGSVMFDREIALACWRLVQVGAIDLSRLEPQGFLLAPHP